MYSETFFTPQELKQGSPASGLLGTRLHSSRRSSGQISIAPIAESYSLNKPPSPHLCKNCLLQGQTLVPKSLGPTAVTEIPGPAKWALKREEKLHTRKSKFCVLFHYKGKLFKKKKSTTFGLPPLCESSS